MSAAAQREELAGPAIANDAAPATALRQIAAERLAAHRNRRAAGSRAVALSSSLTSSLLTSSLLTSSSLTSSSLTPSPLTSSPLSSSPLAPSPADIDLRMAQAAVRLQARRDAAQHTARPNVREAVAARYQQSPSYQEFLAAEAERALQKAQAEAEVAARNAVAVAEAQRMLLDEIDQWNAPPEPLFLVEPTKAAAEATEFSLTPLAAATKPGTPAFASEMWEPQGAATEMGAPHLASEMWEERISSPRRQRRPEPLATADLKIQLYTELPATATAPAFHQPIAFDPEEVEELDQEIAFRLAPEFQTHIVETTPIQANIIEFPRQLVASRKARPRLAEGPLREDGTPEPQLRIFEVEPEQLSTEPVFAQTAAPEWQSIVLSRAPALEPEHLHAHTVAEQEFAAAHNIQLQATPEIHAAPVARRIMAMAVDAVCVAATSLAFLTLAARLCGPALRELPRPELAAVAAIALAIFALLYHVLFFTLNEATPGMLYARIGFCTFAEANPTRREVRRRMLATMVAVSPLGLGLLWTVLDPDRLGWHDRISRMYPRAY